MEVQRHPVSQKGLRTYLAMVDGDRIASALYGLQKKPCVETCGNNKNKKHYY
jgi:hypothetical protein